jgi:phytoene desaturase
MQQKKALIIGSGVAGMATAIRLAVQGNEVHIFEKNNEPGGKLTAFKKDGFHFDAGPSLFTQPQNIVDLFELAQEPIEAYFSYKTISTACKYFYENGKVVNAYTNANDFANELSEKVGENTQTVKKYLSNSENLYNKIGNIFLNNSLHKRKTWLQPQIFKALGAVKFTYLFKTLGKYNTVFKAKETQQIFNRYATYNGSNPYKAPAMLSLIPHLEQNEGTFYPNGGMISITEALYKLALKKGVQFHFNSPVQSIICPDVKAIGIVVNNTNIYADAVVCNGDVYYTYLHLLKNENKANALLKQERSSSAIVFYWGINKKFPELDLHNIFFASNYEAEFNSIFKTKKVFSDPTVYINITSKHDATHAPEGCENWFVMVNLPAHTDYNETALASVIKANILKKLQTVLGEDISKYIVTEETLHPQIIQTKTNSHLGSLYGTSSNSRFAAFFRHPNFSKTIKNLYHCGGSVHPGGGIPLCLKSAQIVSNLIKQNAVKQAKQHA